MAKGPLVEERRIIDLELIAIHRWTPKKIIFSTNIIKSTNYPETSSPFS